MIDPIAYGIDVSPAFMSWGAGRLRILKPGAALPEWNIRGAHSATQQPYTHFAVCRFMPLHFQDFKTPGSAETGRDHRANARLSAPASFAAAGSSHAQSRSIPSRRRVLGRQLVACRKQAVS